MKMKRRVKDEEALRIEDLKRKLRTAQTKGNHKDAADIYNQLGYIFRQLNDFNESLENHLEELKVAKRLNDQMSVGIAHRNIGETYTEMNEEEKAIHHIKLYLKLSIAEANIVEQQRAYITLGRTYLCFAENQLNNEDSVEEEISKNRKEHLQNAWTFFNKGYNILNENELKTQVKERDLLEMKCGACQNMGIVLDCKGQLSDAVRWLNEAINIGIDQKFYNYVHPCSLTLSIIYSKLENMKAAQKAAQQGRKAAVESNNFCMEIESSIQEAKVLFYLNDIESGKRILKKIRKRIVSKNAGKSYLDELDPLLIAAVTISRTQDFLFGTSSKDYSKRMDLHEKLGDNFVEVGNYTEAVNEYLHCVKCALDIPGFESANKKKMSRLYFSIAVTYKDKDDCQNALKYFLKEMEILTTPVEKYRTQTNIVNVLEKLKRPQEEIIKGHDMTIKLASKTGDLTRESKALQNFELYLKRCGRIEEAEKIHKKIFLMMGTNQLPDSEEQDPDSQDMLEAEDEVDLDDLSSEDESDEEDVERKKNEAGRKPKISKKVNEMGETSLHVAAKKGDLKAVRRLLRQGHEVNPRDTAGWLPLHEACNFGHYEVVEELLKRKAFVNDPGGEHCGKTTPIHDAASNGHTQIVKLLIKYGANILAKEEDGNYPIDLLVNWRERLQEENENLSSDAEHDYRDTTEVLKSHMAKAGRPYEKRDERKAKKRVPNKSSHPTFSLMKSKHRNSTSPTPVQIGYDNFDPDDGDAAVDLYSEAITGLRLRNKKGKNKSHRLGRDPNEEDMAPLTPPPKGALISEERNVTEDWLLNDIIPEGKPYKRKRDPMDDVAFQDRTNRKRMGRRMRIDIDDAPEEVEELDRVDASEMSGNSSPAEVMDCDDNRDANGMEFESNGLDEYVDSRYDFPATLTNDRISVEKENIASVSNNNYDDSSNDYNLQSSSGSNGVGKMVRSNCFTISDSDSEDFRPSGFSKNATIQNNRSTGSKLSRNRTPKVVQTTLPFKSVPVSTTKKPSPVSASLKRSSSSNSFHGEGRSVGGERSVLRLKIRIMEHTLLVPIAEDQSSKTIDWLCEECSSRYFKTHGEKPIMTLSTKDGADLSGSDRISFVLGGTETELVASVKGFHLPPLTDRFKTACSENELVLNGEVISALTVCQSTCLLSLEDINIRGKLGRSIFQSLLRQSALRELCLSGCSLFDDGLHELCKILPTLPNISVLNISMNGITCAGFQCFTDVFSLPADNQNNRKSEPPLNIISLDLSHNSLGNSAGRPLSDILSCLTQLKDIRISNCDFTVKLFTNTKSSLGDALSRSKLEDVDISYNHWGELGIDKFLQRINPTRLKSLDCSGCGITDAEAFSQVIRNFLSRNEDCCLLKNMNLSDCNLTDNALLNITEEFSRLVSLENLTLSNNQFISSASMEAVLEKCIENKIPLQRLDMGCCPSMWETSLISSEGLFNMIEKKLQSEKKLLYLRMTIEDTNGSNVDLGDNEFKVANLYEEYSGSCTFDYKRQGNSIVFELQR